MSMIKVIGWVFLSTLIFFVLFIVLQWITHELFLLNRIGHHIILYLVWGAVAYLLPRNYGMIGASVVALFLFFMMLFTHNLYFLQCTVSLLMILGGVSGFLIKEKKYIYSSFTIVSATILLCFAFSKYSSVEFTSVASDDQLSIDLINESNKGVKNML